MPSPSIPGTIESGPRPNDSKSGPEGEPMTPILSASLIVLVPTASSSSSSPGRSISTMMLQRSARMGSSFRSAVVFPGGALDLADEATVGCATEVSSQDDMSNEVYVQALKLCALRETFEETGLLLLPSDRGQTSQGIPWSRAVGHKEAGLTSEEWSSWRDKVHKEAAQFPPFLAQVAAKVGIKSSEQGLPLAELSYHSHWITPRGVVRPGKRFSAHFFLTVLDGSDEIISSRENDSGFSLSADGTETTSLRVSPTDHFINATLNDEIVLYPPQFYILSDIAQVTRKPGLRFEEKLKQLRPLIFGSKDKQVTAIEEEPRNLQGRNYAWDRDTKKPTGWVNSSGNDGKNRVDGRITIIEPHALPGQGANMPLNFSKVTKGDENQDKDDEPFVFPLVLPGDYQASALQSSQFRGQTTDWSKVEPSKRPLNRVYVSPRMKKHGGGLIPAGARRRGISGLEDWHIGAEIEIRPDPSSEEEEEGEGEAPAKSRL
ncbi:unnamed protein product [Sympodiomycopsis kandeliae]